MNATNNNFTKPTIYNIFHWKCLTQHTQANNNNFNV